MSSTTPHTDRPTNIYQAALHDAKVARDTKDQRLQEQIASIEAKGRKHAQR